MKKVYMAVTNNKYELPLALFDSIQTLSFWSGRPIKTLTCYITRGTLDKKLKCKYIRVLIDEEDIE